MGNLSKSLQVLKQKVSRELRKKKRDIGGQKEFVFDRDADSDTAFWQRRFYDFNVWNEKKLRTKLKYMHRNPVDRNLVQHPRDWPWSSWSFYEDGGNGLIRMDVVKPRFSGSQNPQDAFRRKSEKKVRQDEDAEEESKTKRKSRSLTFVRDDSTWWPRGGRLKYSWNWFQTFWRKRGILWAANARIGVRFGGRDGYTAGIY